MSKRLRQEVKEYLMVGIGGMIGASSRYGISVLIADTYSFPYATLLTNWIGCFLLSFMLHHQFKEKLSPEVFAAVNIGVIGSFTTFSTVAVDTILMMSHVSITLLYVVLTVSGCLLFSYFGFRLATRKQGDV